jgi:hypothetical protein
MAMDMSLRWLLLHSNKVFKAAQDTIELCSTIKEELDVWSDVKQTRSCLIGPVVSA